MKKFSAIVMITCVMFSLFACRRSNNETFVSYHLNPKKQQIQLFWKSNQGKIYRSIGNLKSDLKRKNKQLLFAMNGGMYQPDNSPQGLFIEDSQIITPIDTNSGTGNFYIKPNGVFYITSTNDAGICKTEDFRNNQSIKYATQSGPMLLIDGRIHDSLNPQSKSSYVRNGVGILPDKSVLFAISSKEISMYEFADYFKKAGCTTAVYLDGFVSRMYHPEKNWKQVDGDFAVIIAVVKNE